MIGFALNFGVVAFWKFRLFLIFSTSFIGSYAFIRGISIFIGGFPNEFTIIQEIKNHSLALDHEYIMGAYILCILLLTGVGIVVQSKISKINPHLDDTYFSRLG